MIVDLSYHKCLFLSFSFSLLSLSSLFDIYGRVLFPSVAHFSFIKNKIHVLHLSRFFYDNEARNCMLASVMIHADSKEKLDVFSSLSD